jgi:hypothetical protein
MNQYRHHSLIYRKKVTPPFKVNPMDQVAAIIEDKKISKNLVKGKNPIGVFEFDFSDSINKLRKEGYSFTHSGENTRQMTFAQLHSSVFSGKSIPAWSFSLTFKGKSEIKIIDANSGRIIG